MSNDLLTLDFIAEETDKQYNAFASKYSEMVQEHNRESIAAYFRHLDHSLKGKKVLDLACGEGSDLANIKPFGAITFGIDASEEMIKIAKQKNPTVDIKVGYFDKIPFEDHFFDVVISKWALQISSDIDAVYQEIARVIKPHGKLIYLASHPIRQFMEKKRNGKDYFETEIVDTVFFDGKITEKAPSHTMNEYLSATFFQYFSLESYEESYDDASEKVNGDTYPTYFIIKAQRL